MNHPGKIATVLGGTGFLGRYVVQRLAKAGFTVKVATRAPENAYFLRPYGAVGQVVPFPCDYTEEAITRAVADADCVINCVGILFERRRGDFEKIHIGMAQRIAAACRAQGVDNFVHISALGIERSGSSYAITKREGEKVVREAFPSAMILKPSIMFGPEDRFFNRFAEMARFLPCLPLIGGGHTKFQPVYVADVADAVMAALADLRAKGRTFELGGPEVASFRDIYARIFDATGRHRCLMSLPWGMAKMQAGIFSLLPGEPLLTPDQVEQLKADSIVTPGAAGLPELGIMPTAMDAVVPGYLEYKRRGGRVADKKRA